MSKTATKKKVAKKAPAATVPETPAEQPQPNEEVMYLDPATIMDASNIRYGLLPARLEEMKKDIKETGFIRQWIEVEELTPEEKEANPGFEFKRFTGAYRHAAALELNNEGMHLTIPAVRRTTKNPLDRMIKQISENENRQSMTPMDYANAIKELLAKGATKPTIRSLFPRSTGKKMAMKEASNSWLNMMLSFMDFPANIRARIHDGRISVKAAYELRKEPKENWAKIIEDIETKRLAELEKEERAETKILEDERKATEKETKEQDISTKLTEAETIAAEAAKAAEAKKLEAKAAYDARLMAGTKLTKEEKKKLEDDYKSKEGARVQAIAAQAKAQAQLEKIRAAQAKAEKARADAEAKKNAQPAPAPAPPPTPEATVTAANPIKPAEVAASSAAVSGKAPKAATVKEQLDRLLFGIKSIVVLSKPLTRYPNTAKIGTHLDEYANGKIEDGQLHLLISKLLAEPK